MTVSPMATHRRRRDLAAHQLDDCLVLGEPAQRRWHRGHLPRRQGAHDVCEKRISVCVYARMCVRVCLCLC